MVKICVIGSCAVDLVVTSDRRPGAGETVLGESFRIVPGGKGANQAVAAARLGAEVVMIGRVGEDNFGDVILNNLKLNGVNTSHVEAAPNLESGTAHIVLAEGDNSIVVVKGANDLVTPEYIRQKLNVIQEMDIVLIQQEIPEDTVAYVSHICTQAGIPLLLNPAPAREVDPSVIEHAAYLTPNEHEAALLFGGLSPAQALRKYPNKLIITEGAQGARYYNGREEVLVPAYKVEVVDTTGAGDTFNAAFAVSIAEGKSIFESVRFANRAASLSVAGFGAQGGMPARDEVEAGL
ncbi:ribokinase [Paenibacillus sp. YPG26]|uniref:ribokinase n=1 Tax=Paenibacillus sp. YPG26 TaxID=2878915 RepID=UPI00203C2C40|nr:ribokinase [Paenibacillus sp. YPG26]USB31802.1 ribokinase [Paenibacillus sp. YPG26]